MKISEVIRELQKSLDEYGDLPVHYDNSDFYPSEVKYVEFQKHKLAPGYYRQNEKPAVLIGEHILLI